MQATAVGPVDATGAFWRIELGDGAAVVLPVRELRATERLAFAPSAPEVVGVAPPPELADPGPRRGCDPAGDARLLRWDALTAEAAERHGLDPALVRAVIAVESCGDPHAVSRKGAVGLMQLMPATARDYGCQDPRDPSQNIDTGCRHLARLMNKMGDLDLALAAYNAGEGAVSKAGGVPNFRETKAYVRDVKRHAERLGRSLARTAAQEKVASPSAG